MSLMGSLFSGVSGLNAQSRAMGMISDNIANVSTTAYKGASAQFSNLIARKIGATAHTPGGVRVHSVYNISNPGLIQPSASPTDLAIAGSGFFVVNGLADGAGEQAFTRAGSFAPDAEGNLRTPSGHFLQGWALDQAGAVADVNQLRTVNIADINGVAVATANVEFQANLDADQAPVAAAGYAIGDMAAGNVEPHFELPIEVFDSLGQAHDVKLAFLRTGAVADKTWQVEVIVDGAADEAASGQVTFGGDGKLVANTLPAAVNVAWANGANPSNVAFDLGNVVQLAGRSEMTSKAQDGTAPGALTGVSVDVEGFVNASFSNGETRRVFQLPIATFANPGALDPRSGNVFAQTQDSGEFNLKIAGTAGAGSVTPEALEGANVDLGEEFTKMIVTQRAYSANAKVINTTDQMLDELIRIGR
jgi:flagellar hook protein FlgE